MKKVRYSLSWQRFWNTFIQWTHLELRRHIQLTTCWTWNRKKSKGELILIQVGMYRVAHKNMNSKHFS